MNRLIGPAPCFLETPAFSGKWFQTIAAPVLTALLICSSSRVLDERPGLRGRRAYTAFLIPGLVMMSVLQNAFANSSRRSSGPGDRQPCFRAVAADFRIVRIFPAYVLQRPSVASPSHRRSAGHRLVLRRCFEQPL